MKDLSTFKIGKFKCFNEPCGFDKIFPMNIIIGKNNSGKSSLLTLIKFLVERDVEVLKNPNGGEYGNVYFEKLITDNDVKRIYSDSGKSSHTPQPFNNDYQYGTQLIDKKIRYQLYGKLVSKVDKIDFDFGPLGSKAEAIALKEFSKKYENYKTIFDDKVYRSISAERDIVSEGIGLNSTFKVEKNGINATKLIELIVNKAENDSKLIEKILLKELNLILSPEMEFTDIIPQKIDNSTWEIFFEDKKERRIALSQMGSGIKTILLVLLNLIVIPEYEKIEKSNYVFCFEELENNLHPALQRKLFKYIEDYSKQHNCLFFITTHSNIVIDSFGSSERAQIIHIKNKEGQTVTNSSIENKDYKNILTDLDIKASDILQSNGIIWVEGPSDRTYLKKFISLLNPNLIEGINYSIMYYGGRLLSNISFDYDVLTDNLIPLLKINSNSFVMMDRDGDKISSALNKTKKRIIDEIGIDNVWVTKGREIENYLHESLIIDWLNNQHEQSVDKISLNSNEKIESSIKQIDAKIDYSKHKAKYSKEIASYIKEDHLDILDLEPKLKSLVEIIKSWNNY